MILLNICIVFIIVDSIINNDKNNQNNQNNYKNNEKMRIMKKCIIS